MSEKRPKKASKTRRKSTGKSTGAASAVPVGALVRQPHGGALRNGGTNKGGWGRPPEALRALSREEFWGLMLEVQRRRRGGQLKQAELSELAQLIGQTGRFALGEKVELTVASPDIQARLARQVVVIHSRASWTPAELLDALDEVWT